MAQAAGSFLDLKEHIAQPSHGLQDNDRVLPHPVAWAEYFKEGAQEQFNPDDLPSPSQS